MIQVTGYDPKTNLIHYPISMWQFGQNPYGENLWRIVLARSRRSMIGGVDGLTGVAGYHWAVTYDNVPANAWVIEKWLAPDKYTNLNKEQWDLQYRDPFTGLLLLGPFPDRGEYQMSISIAPEDISDFNIGLYIQWVEMGKKNSPQDRLDGIRREQAAKEKEIDAYVEGTIRERLPAYGIRPMFSSHVGRGSERAEGVIHMAAPKRKNLVTAA